MKDKIILFVIGILVGAVIATGTFYIYTSTSKSNDCNSNNTQMNGEQLPEMPGGQNGGNGQPPEKPNGDMGEPPAKPNDNNLQNSNQNNNQ